MSKGVSLYITIMIMTVLLTIVFGLTGILLSRMKITRGMGYSVIAFYAADTGIERMLMDRNSPVCPAGPYLGYLDLNNNAVQDSGDATYDVTVTAAGPNCAADNCCVKSTGSYQQTKRAIEISY